MRKAIRHNAVTSTRKAAAVVELAICLPLLLLLVFGGIETSGALHLSQTLHASAYEAVRVAVQRTSTNAIATTAANRILTGARVVNGTVRISDSDVSKVPQGNSITVTVSAPYAGNQMTSTYFFRGKTLTARGTMVKE